MIRMNEKLLADEQLFVLTETFAREINEYCDKYPDARGFVGGRLSVYLPGPEDDEKDIRIWVRREKARQ